jgi:tRNA A-37 threonylcarbamoyl transferase component Bud32/outer membrane protein assembly factor BamB
VPAPTTANEFLGLAHKAGVLDEAALARAFPEPDELPADPHRCAAVLVKAGLLTAFQAKSLLAGKHQGLLIGSYRVLEPVGQGGMGVVYKAEHTALKRPAAVKVLPPEKAKDKVSLDRFLREARAAAALDHPNIVRLYDVGQAAGVHFLALEYVDGMTLDKLVERTGPLHFPTAAHYVAQAAAGLRHAHDQGFVHRDIKPGNLMVARDGTVKILDMGLARSLASEEDKLTERLDGSTILGTVDYISPEQAINAPDVDHRADIYSLGATFYALVTGRPPFDGNATQKLMQHQVAEAPRLAEVRAVPEGLSDVVAKMMAKRPEDRYQSAAEVIDALAPWLPATPATFALDAATTTTGTITRTGTGRTTTRVNLARATAGTAWLQRPPARRRRWPLAAGIVAALLLVAGGVYWAASGSGGKTTVIYEPPPDPAAAADRPVRLTGWTDAPERLAVAPDGKTMVTCGARGRVGVWDLALPGMVGELTGHTKTVWHAGFSPDGKLVATASKDGTVRVWHVRGRAENWSFERPGLEARAAVFSPDGRKVIAAFTGLRNQVVALDAATGQLLKSRQVGPCHWLAVIPGGRTVALAAMRPNRVVVWDYDADRVGHEFPLGNADGEPRAVAVSPDGATLAVAGGPWRADGLGFLLLLDARTGAERWRATPPDAMGALCAVRFSRTGRHLVTTGYGGKVRLWDAATGRQVEAFEHDSGPQSVGAAAFAAGGRAVVSGGKDGSLWLWPLTAPAYRYQPVPLGPAATASSADQVLTSNPPAKGNKGSEGRVLLPDWGPRQVNGVPFVLTGPQAGANNVIVLNGPLGRYPPKMPTAVAVPIGVPAAAVHLLGGVGGWGWPFKGTRDHPAPAEGAVALTVRLRYADGTAEDHPLRHGVEYADWVSKDDLPGAKVAAELQGGRCLRYLAVKCGRTDVPLAAVEFVKEPNDVSAPLIVGLTVETP